MKRFALAAGLIAASTGLAAAHDTAPVERELRRQAQLIEDGRRTGELTFQEVRMLTGEQSRIGWMLTQARYDGTVTRSEFNAICEAQEVAKSNIAFEAADSDTSPWRRRYADRYDRGYGDGWGRRDDTYGRWGGWGGYGRWRNPGTY